MGMFAVFPSFEYNTHPEGQCSPLGCVQFLSYREAVPHHIPEQACTVSAPRRLEIGDARPPSILVTSC